MHKYHRLVSIIDPAGDHHHYESGIAQLGDVINRFLESRRPLFDLAPFLKPISLADFAEIEQSYKCCWILDIDMQRQEFHVYYF